jgi:hypothetical protein
MRRSDIPTLAASLGCEPDDVFNVETSVYDRPHLINGDIDGLDAAGPSEIHDLRDAGVAFYGTHGQGVEYPAEAFACDGKTLVFVELSDQDVVVRLNSRGKPLAVDVANARQYRKVLAAAKRKLKKG